MSQWKKLRLFFRISWETVPSYIVLLVVQTLLTGGRVVMNVVLPKFLSNQCSRQGKPSYG